MNRVSLQKKALSRLWMRTGTVMLTLMCTVASLAARAQDADDAPTPIDPATAAAQNKIIGTILVVIIVVIGLYWLRRWQISNRADATSNDQRD